MQPCEAFIKRNKLQLQLKRDSTYFPESEAAKTVKRTAMHYDDIADKLDTLVNDFIAMRDGAIIVRAKYL